MGDRENNDCESEDTHQESGTTTEGSQMIEMNVAIGELDSNPIINTLLDNDESNDDGDHVQKGGNEKNVASASVAQSLGKNENGKAKDIMFKEVSTDGFLMKEISTKRRKAD